MSPRKPIIPVVVNLPAAVHGVVAQRESDIPKQRVITADV
jgi:hypothetical protein